MAPLQVGDQFPEGVKFEWVPVEAGETDATACGRPQEYDANKNWEGKKVVLVSVPGAFTPGCQANHLPPYMSNLEKLRGKGVDIVAFIAYNDAWVMSAWSKVNNISSKDILFLSDTKSFFSKGHGWPGPGDRNGRWAMVIDKDGKVVYAEAESQPGVTVSGAEAVLAKI